VSQSLILKNSQRFLLILSILLVVTLGVCVAAPGPSSFDLTTNVQGINLMKITKAQFAGNGPGDFNGAAAADGEVEV
jgi:hypothetical protein